MLRLFACTIRQRRLYKESRIAKVAAPLLGLSLWLCSISRPPNLKPWPLLSSAPELLRSDQNARKRKGTTLMNEISKLLQERFGLSQDQALEAERAILGLIRAKVPTQFQGLFDSALGSGQAAGGEQAEASSSAPAGGLLSAAEGLLSRG